MTTDPRYQVRQAKSTGQWFVVDMARVHPNTPSAHLIVARGSEAQMLRTADELNTGRIELINGQELDPDEQ